jgi:hypothetical protein
VVDAEWTDVHPDPDRGTIVAAGRSVKYLRPAVMMEPDALRELLHRLGTRVVLHWEPHGKRYFRLDYARIKAEFAPNNSSAGGNSTTTASSSRPAGSGAWFSRG